MSPRHPGATTRRLVGPLLRALAAEERFGALPTGPLSPQTTPDTTHPRIGPRTYPQAGHGEDRLLLARVLAVVAGFLVFSVACNDLADEAIDRINLPGDTRRPLVSGAAGRRDLVVTGAFAAVAALAVSTTLHWPAVVVTAVGLALSAGYSLRPVRLADRGAVASLVLPACYVAVPYLLGILAARPVVRSGDLLLLAGLYAGFIGRILL